MERAYAGILGPLAFVTMLARNWFAESAPSTKLAQAWLALVAFAVLGFIIGWIAARIVEDSLRAQILAELAEAEPKPPGAM